MVNIPIDNCNTNARIIALCYRDGYAKVTEEAVAHPARANGMVTRWTYECITISNLTGNYALH